MGSSHLPLPETSVAEGEASGNARPSWVASFFPNLRDAAIRWSEDDAGSLAASVAYYLALSLFPMLLLLISGLSLFLQLTGHSGAGSPGSQATYQSDGGQRSCWSDDGNPSCYRSLCAA